MTRNSEAPEDAPTQARSRPGQELSRSGPVAELALVAAGLGLVVYLLAFVGDAGLGTQMIGPLLLGGGLLAGAVVLPTVGAGVLVPAAVATTTGALLLLQAVVGGRDSAVAVGTLVLAVLEAAAALGAALLHAGVVRAPTSRPKRAPKKKADAATPPVFPGYPQQPGAPHFPGQQFPGQQYAGPPYAGVFPGPGQPARPFPGDPYAGEHAYAQQAHHGAQYGVPGYPPPPPYAPPGIPGQPAYRPAPAPDPKADPATAVVPLDAAPRAAEPAEAPVASSSATPSSSPPEASVEGSGAHRVPAVDPSVRASGSHRAPTPPRGGPAVPDGGADADGDDRGRTRVIPTVPGERPPS
jgi:Family of unknown function (DUF5336)